ncbi:MFS transporter [Aspergillus stella-maris]|uniref:MFS transporter n=1 Tax=Aspergillus stella-maris TaxID=1810926 RepID=UPI003CCE1E80
MATVTIELPTRDPLRTLPDEAGQAFESNADAPVARVKHRWNGPSTNKWRIAAIFPSFAVVGSRDGIREDFKLSTTVVSLIFMTPFAGYTLASNAVNKTHMTFGHRRIAAIASLCHLILFIITVVVLRFSVLLVAYAFVGFGNGPIDAGWNAWIGGSMVNAISPVVATAMIDHDLEWSTFYHTLVGGSALELVTSGLPFGSTSRSCTTEAVKSRVTWVLTFFLFTHMGVEDTIVSIGGWVVEFMMQVRDGSAAGITVGRIILGFVNKVLDERLQLVLAVALELAFWLVPQFIVSDVAVSLIGYFTPAVAEEDAASSHELI